MDRNIFPYILRPSPKAQILILAMTVGPVLFRYATLERPKFIIKGSSGRSPRSRASLKRPEVPIMYDAIGPSRAGSPSSTTTAARSRSWWPPNDPEPRITPERRSFVA
jgi:hypothetical protein